MNRCKRAGVLAMLPFLLAAVFFAPKAALADGPGVARISLIQGTATVTRGDSQQPVAGAVNAPLMAADYLSTGASTYLEVQFDGMSMLRMAADTQLRFANLDPNARAVQLADGTVELGLVRGGSAATTIDTPSVSVSASQMGDYRVSVMPNGSTWVTVRTGVASLITPHGTQTLYPGRTAIAAGAASNPSVSYVDAPAEDAFDTFNTLRNNVALSAYNASSPYLDPSVGGSTDFTQYGNWVSVAGYGNVWSPYQNAGWAPYRNGRWVWEPTYGWTWVGYEPWGWAPYHYGRWFFAANQGWCWYPPQFGVAWQPALVGFLGNFLGLNIGLNFGNIAWVPLAPYEQYYGWNNAWGRGYNNVTYFTNITNVNNYYSNLKHGGATAPAFRGNPIDGNRPADIDTWKRWTIVRGPLNVVPTHGDLAYDGRIAAQPVTISGKFGQPRFAQRLAAQPLPFSAQVERMKTLASAPVRVIPVKAEPAAPLATAKVNDSWGNFARSRGATDGIPAHAVSGGAMGTAHSAVYTPSRAVVPGSQVMPHLSQSSPAAASYYPAAPATYSAPAAAHSATYAAPVAHAGAAAASHAPAGGSPHASSASGSVPPHSR